MLGATRERAILRLSVPQLCHICTVQKPEVQYGTVDATAIASVYYCAPECTFQEK